MNDEPIIYLASAQPLWRDLAIGDKGQDVKSLQTELGRLGIAVAENGVSERSTLAATNELARRNGSRTARQSLEVGQYTWLPAPSVSAQSCELGVGDQVTAGATLSKLPQGISAARIEPSPINVMPGARVVAIDDQAIPVDATGAVTDPRELDKIALSTAYRNARLGALPPTQRRPRKKPRPATALSSR
ncbi:hypothetical protein [Leifsonia poae]|uniref:hypothetical protein n=1 Tax=Leifsonia poae TaxID=110933 RepID=UPI003D67DE2A